MCEPESVEYLRDLFQEKENIEKLEGHHIIKSLLNQGIIICYSNTTHYKAFCQDTFKYFSVSTILKYDPRNSSIIFQVVF